VGFLFGGIFITKHINMNRSYSKIRHIQESNQRLENRLLESQDDEGKSFHNLLKTLFKKGGVKPPNEFKRRMSDDFTDDYIYYLINKEMEENDPNDFSDEFEFADNIISWSVTELGLPDEIDEWDVINYLKDQYSDMIFDYYISNSDDDEHYDDDDDDF
jgi:hypothetical protein